MRLSLSMITKNELANLKRLKPLVEPHVDEWVVVFPPNDPAIDWAKENGITAIVKDFTTAIDKKTAKKFSEYGADAPEGYRIFNFAAARNESLKHCSGDYVLWLDADDKPVGLENLREYIEGRLQIDVFDCVYDYARDLEGNPISDHVRERVFRNNGKFTWKGGAMGVIHETVVAENFHPKHTKVPKDVFNVEHVPEPGHDIESNIRNHVALLYEYIKTDGKDPRTIYYLGTSFFNMKQFELCIKTLMEYIKVGGWDEERYRAWIRIAEAYHQLGDKESSRNAYLNAQKELPKYPDAYFGMGESYYSDEIYDKAIEYLEMGLQKEIPKTKSAIDYTKYLFRPLPFLALANLEMGYSEKAVAWFQKARKVNPKHDWVVKYTPLFVDTEQYSDYIKSFVKTAQIAQKLYPETLPKLAEAIPDTIMDQELLLSFKRRYAPTETWGDNSIVFFCSQAFEEWSHKSLETGTGGSEEAIIQLSKRFVAMGWDVTIYNNCPEELTDPHGVKWVRYERFNPNDDFNILVSWRNNPFIEPKKARKAFIDMHDVPNVQYFTKEYVDNVSILAKSQYHRSLFPHLDDDNFTIIPNGVDMAQFDKKPKKKKNNLVWTSSYDRGLEYLLEMWPDIRKEVPDATLDIAYGWNLYDKSAQAKTKEGQKWKAKMLPLMEQEGITHHGRVNSDEVAEMYLKAEVWAYPTDFPEIDCITATKAMAAGCAPITTDFAVMKERNQGIMIKGDIKKTKSKFKKELIDLLKSDKKKKEVVERIDVSMYHWDNIAKRWDEEFRKPIMDEYPLVSVIIPTHNRPDMLKECLESVLTQSYPNVEIIVVDDSSDEPVKVPSGVKLKRVEYKNPSKTLNEGIKIASGDYHFNMDDDDKFWSRHSLLHYMKTAVDTGAELVFSDLMMAFPNKEVVLHEPFTTWEELKKNNTLPGVYLVESKVSKETPYDPDFKTAHDYRRNLAFAEKDIKVAKASGPLYWYRQHGKQINYEQKEQQTADVERARKA